VGLFYEINETLSADKALEKLLVLFHILYIVLEIENIVGTIPLLILSCFITRVRGNLTGILVFLLLLYRRIIEIFKCIDQKDQKV
jgi:succinate-acetate transporter protein